MPQITHLLLHLLSLLLFQAEIRGRYLYKQRISALHQVLLDCTWRGAPDLPPKADLIKTVLKVADMRMWERAGVPRADLEASAWLLRG